MALIVQGTGGESCSFILPVVWATISPPVVLQWYSKTELSSAIITEQASLADVAPYHLHRFVAGLVHDGSLTSA